MSVSKSGFSYVYQPAPAGSGDLTLLMLHGTGGNEHDLLPLGHALAPGAALLSPRGRVLEQGQPRFFRRLAEGVFDLEDLHHRTAELKDFVAEMAESHAFTGAPLVAVGFSNGANIAGSLLLSAPELLAGAVLLRPMVPFVPETMPDLSGVNLFVGAGTADPLVPVAETERWVTMLREAGANVEMHWHPGGHGLGQDDVEHAQRWLERQEWRRNG
jgi:predicted esterase